MSDYGLRVFNNNNQLQIDSLYQNYSLLLIGTAVTHESTAFIISGVGEFYVDLTGYPELSDASNFITLYRFPHSDKWLMPAGTVPGTVSGLVFGNSGFGGGVGVSVDYAVFIKKMNTTSGYGLKVWSPSGKLIINTQDRLLTIQDVFNLHPWLPPGAGLVKTITHGRGHHPWVLPPINQLYFWTANAGEYYTWNFMFRSPNINQIQSTAEQMYYLSGGAGGVELRGLDYLSGEFNAASLTAISYRPYV